MFCCKFCSKPFSKGYSLGGHTNRCSLNPNRVPTPQGHQATSARQPLSSDHKAKIAASRTKYLQENPDRVPYVLNHSSKRSNPELTFESALKAHAIGGWVSEYRAGIYSYDFAFPDIKLDVEIDGGTHEQEKVKKIDERRDAWSKARGWRVLRITAKSIAEDVDSQIALLKSLL